MLQTMLVVFGIIFMGLGIVGLFSLIVRPFIMAIKRVYLHRTDDSEKEYKFLKVSFGFFIVIGVICLIFGRFLKYAPRGNESLFSENIVGAATGNENMEYQQSQDNANGIRDSYYVTVSEKTIYVNGQEIGDTEKFEEYLKTLDRNHTILLIDDFAVSPTYHKTEKLLNDYGMTIKEESDE